MLLRQPEYLVGCWREDDEGDLRDEVTVGCLSAGGQGLRMVPSASPPTSKTTVLALRVSLVCDVMAATCFTDALARATWGPG